jgi:hypothetical protein
MGPERYCSLCNGSHPEGLHYTVRGALEPEPATSLGFGPGAGTPRLAAVPAEHSTPPLASPSRRAEARR